MQLRFLQALAKELKELDEDSNENMSVSALLEPQESPPVENFMYVGFLDGEEEAQLGAGDL